MTPNLTEGDSMNQKYCYDERHDTPCPLPCAACEADGCCQTEPTKLAAKSKATTRVTKRVATFVNQQV